MFSKKEVHNMGKLETIIGQDSVFQGNLKTKGAVRIDGKLEGNVTDAVGVVIGDHGVVAGDVIAKIIVIGGKVSGNVTAQQSLEILAKSQVYGDIHTALLTIGEGAVFEGNCVMNAGETDKVIDMDAEVRKRHG
ncbi:MAG: polymer-forming cytoskeletal protein [Endomicrobiia bacterium]|nr:polymer-forming cytoskeletal protein [Endomicrobiia bacterium]